MTHLVLFHHALPVLRFLHVPFLLPYLARGKILVVPHFGILLCSLHDEVLEDFGILHLVAAVVAEEQYQQFRQEEPIQGGEEVLLPPRLTNRVSVRKRW